MGSAGIAGARQSAVHPAAQRLRPLRPLRVFLRTGGHVRQRAGNTVPRGTDDLRDSTAGRSGDRILHTPHSDENDSVARGDRLPAAHFQPESQRPADHSRRRFGRGSRRRPQGAPGTEPADPGAVGDQGADDDPSPGLHDQRQRGRREGELLRRRHGGRHAPRRHLPRVLEGGDPLARQLGPAAADSGSDLPGRPEAGQPLPTGPRGRWIRHPRQAPGLGPARSPYWPADHRLRRPAAVAADRVRDALLRLRTRHARHAGAVRHLPGGKRIRPLGQRTALAALADVPEHRQRARRKRLPGRPPAVLPDRQRRQREHARRQPRRPSPCS